MKRILNFLFMLLMLALPAQAQTFDQDPNAHFSWPLPVYLLRGEVSLRGTANLPNMVSYFIEYRQLNDDLTANEENSWTPATLPNPVAVTEGVLGTWDTRAAPDGLYELRMTLNVRSGNPVFVILSPLRVENEIPPFVITATPQPIPTLVPPTATRPPIIPTLVPTPTALDLTPRVEAITNANVRQGDGLVFPVIDNLPFGQQANIIGLSVTGSGWYQILLPSGRTGWIAPSVVRVSGDLRSVPRVMPPPPPPPTQTPFPTPIPAQANLVIQQITLSPDPPNCGQTYTLTVRVLNNGTGNSMNSGAISVQDIHLNTGTIAGSTVGAFPPLNPGESFDAVMRLTVSIYFQETHRINIIINSAGQVAETNKTDNVGVRDYTLAKAGCF